MKTMQSRFWSTCKVCGDKIQPGETIAHLGKGHAEHIECYNARIASEPSDDIVTPATDAPVPTTGDAWSASLAWDTNTPKPGASIGGPVATVEQVNNVQVIRATPRPVPAPQLDTCDACKKPAELSHNDTTGTALCGDCDAAVNALQDGRQEFESLLTGAVKTKTTHKYYVWFHLVGEYDAESESEAFDMAMRDIENRDGLEIAKHEILPAMPA